jgi:hypothetical protein
MEEAMSIAPTLNAPHIELPPVEDSPTLQLSRRNSPVATTIHRRSYALATRKESFEGL